MEPVAFWLDIRFYRTKILESVNIRGFFMKSGSYRFSLLVGCATIALCAAAPSVHAALTGGSNDPSIEIHLDVLDGLKSQPQPVAAPKPSAAATIPAGEPVPAHKVAKKTVAAKPVPAKKVAKKPVKETTVASGVDTSDADAVPKPEVKSSSAEVPPPASDAPKPSVVADAAPPAAPVAAADNADVPKLSESEIKASASDPKKKGVLSGISGGFSDFLSNDSDKKPAPVVAVTLPKAPVVAAVPVAPAAAPATNAAAAASLASPPPDLTAHAAPPPLADKEIPSAPLSLAAASDKKVADTAPPLLELKSDNESGDKGPPKLVVASNDTPPPALTPRLEDNSAKADLPSLPAPDGSDAPPPELMAQSTLAPGAASAPVAAGAAKTAPAAAPATAVAPAPAATPAATAPAAAAAPPPVPTVNPTPQAASGGTPNLQVVFNENETDLPLNATGPLDAFAKVLNQNAGTRVEILAYASGPETTGIYPKRVSLARGIAVRNYLTTNKSIEIERVNVKAMGRAEKPPGDRVDLFILK